MSALLNRGRDERGATLVEFALVALLLFSLLFVVVNFSLIEIGNSVGSNAAREGARYGIINVDCADSYPGSAKAGHDGCASPSTNYSGIVNAVRAKLVGLVAGLTVSVRCLDGSDPTGATEKACTVTGSSGGNTALAPDVDLIEVSATWSHVGSSPFVSTKTHTDLARMVITEAPGAAASGSASACVVNSVSYSPAPPEQIDGSGHLIAPMTTTAVTNGNAACSGMKIQYTPDGTTAQLAKVMTNASPNFTDTVAQTDYVWTIGFEPVRIFASDGTLIFNGTIQIVGACIVNSVSFNPPTEQIDGSGHLTAQMTTTAVTNGNAACSGLKVQYTPDGTTAQPAKTMTNATPTFTDIVGTTAYTWVAGDEPVQILDSAGHVLFDTAVIVTSSGCSVTSVTFAPTPPEIIDVSGHLTAQMTTTATTNGNAACAGLQVQYTPNGTTAQPRKTMTNSSPTFTDIVGTSDYTWVAGNEPVQIFDSGGNVLFTTSVRIANPAPTITSPTTASPYKAGKDTGMHTINVVGTNFLNGLTVTVNGVFTLDSFTWVNSTTISVSLTGKGANNGTGDLTVTNPDGQSVTATASLVNG